jgi:hypothetical protein
MALRQGNVEPYNFPESILNTHREKVSLSYSGGVPEPGKAGLREFLPHPDGETGLENPLRELPHQDERAPDEGIQLQ